MLQERNRWSGHFISRPSFIAVSNPFSSVVPASKKIGLAAVSHSSSPWDILSGMGKRSDDVIT